VVVYGYVAILFGRARATEDIDILVKDMDQESFEKFWREIHKSFWCLNAENSEDAFRVLGGLTRAPNIVLKTCKKMVDFFNNK
jgi:hypothetical protein